MPAFSGTIADSACGYAAGHADAGGFSRSSPWISSEVHCVTMLAAIMCLQGKSEPRLDSDLQVKMRNRARHLLFAKDAQ